MSHSRPRRKNPLLLPAGYVARGPLADGGLSARLLTLRERRVARVRIGNDDAVQFGDLEPLWFSAAFIRALAAGVVDEDAAHGFGGGLEELALRLERGSFAKPKEGIECSPFDSWYCPTNQALGVAPGTAPG